MLYKICNQSKRNEFQEKRKKKAVVNKDDETNEPKVNTKAVVNEPKANTRDGETN